MALPTERASVRGVTGVGTLRAGCLSSKLVALPTIGTRFNMNRRLFNQILQTLAAAGLGLGMLFNAAHAAGESAEDMISRLSTDVLASIKADPGIKNGDLSRLMALVDSKIMPNVNFLRMTASSVGPGWRQATPEQRKRLQEEYKILLVRTYAGALSQVDDVELTVKPTRGSPQDTELVIRTEVKGQGEPVQLDYRMEKTPGVGAGWKIYDLSILGVWLVQSYRGQFAAEVNSGGVDGLISALVARNKANAKKG